MTTIERVTAKIALAITDVVREVVKEELAALHRADPDEWVPHTAWPVKSRRVACELARAAKIPAKRSGKLWLARRRDIDAYIAAQPEAAAKPAANDAIDDLAGAMVRAARSRRTAGGSR